MSNQTIYSSKDLNEILGYTDISGRNSTKAAILTRCKNAGLIVQALETKRGLSNQYVIIEDNFHLDGEEWRDCYCQKDWEVSNLGRIRRKHTKKLMGTTDPTSHYIRVTTADEKTGKQTNLMVHRLIYFSFFPELIPLSNTLQIDHVNGQRNDNRLNNLQALSNVQNIQNRDTNQDKIKLITTNLIIKYGYEKVEQKLQELLTNGI